MHHPVLLRLYKRIKQDFVYAYKISVFSRSATMSRSVSTNGFSGKCLRLPVKRKQVAVDAFASIVS